MEEYKVHIMTWLEEVIILIQIIRISVKNKLKDKVKLYGN